MAGLKKKHEAISQKSRFLKSDEIEEEIKVKSQAKGLKEVKTIPMSKPPEYPAREYWIFWN